MGEAERVDPVPEPKPADVISTEPATQEPAKPAVDESLKAELEAMKQQLQQVNEQNRNFQVILGQQLQQRQAQNPTSPTKPLSEQYSADDRKMVQEVAKGLIEETISKLTVQSEMQQRIGNDAEIAAEYQRQIQALAANPAFNRYPEETLGLIAAERARSVILEKRMNASQKNTTQAVITQANRNMAQASNLPPTGAGKGDEGLSEKDTFVRGFMASPENRAFLKRFDRVDPDSEEGQKLLRETAESNWNSPVMIGGKTALAARAIQQGAMFSTKGE